MIEIEELMEDDKTLICLTETQLKIKKVKPYGNIQVMESMRDFQDKKGGGLMMLHRKSDIINLKQMQNRNKDYLHVKGEIVNKQIHIILVYFSVNDKERNKNLREEIEKHIEELKDNLLIVMGDFNGHVGFLGKQEINKNGELIIDWMENYDLILLNNDSDCTGEYTWSRDQQKSVIGYVLISNGVYDMFHSMYI